MKLPVSDALFWQYMVISCAVITNGPSMDNLMLNGTSTPKVVIIPISLYMHNDQQKSKAEFLKLGISRWSILWHFLPLPGFLTIWRGPSLPSLFDRYRRGEFTTVEFRNNFRSLFPRTVISDKDFDSAWNAMQNVTSLTRNAFLEANNLVQRGFDVRLIAGTNELHKQDILRKAELQLFPGTAFFSHEKKLLGNDLFSALIKEIRQQYPTIRKEDIVYFYSEPQDPFPRLGKLAWLLNPLRKFEYNQAKNYVTRLKREAANLGFTLVESEKGASQANISTSLAKLGWHIDMAVNEAERQPEVAPAPQVELQPQRAIVYRLRSRVVEAPIANDNKPAKRRVKKS